VAAPRAPRRAPREIGDLGNGALSVQPGALHDPLDVPLRFHCSSHCSSHCFPLFLRQRLFSRSHKALHCNCRAFSIVDRLYFFARRLGGPSGPRSFCALIGAPSQTKRPKAQDRHGHRSDWLSSARIRDWLHRFRVCHFRSHGRMAPPSSRHGTPIGPRAARRMQACPGASDEAVLLLQRRMSRRCLSWRSR
jgi:hypothetical protein